MLPAWLQGWQRLVCWSVHHFGADSNISPTMDLIAIKFGILIHVFPQD